MTSEALELYAEDSLVPPQVEDPWRSGLDNVLAKFHLIGSPVIVALEREAAARDKFASAASECAPHVVRANVEAWQEQLLAWACERYIELLPTETELARRLFWKRHHNALENRITLHTKEFRDVMQELQVALLTCAQCADENASNMLFNGIGAFINGFSGNILGAIGNVKSMYDGGMAEETALLQLQHTFEKASQIAGIAISSTDAEIVKWWNSSALADAERTSNPTAESSSTAELSPVGAALTGLLLSSCLTLALLVVHWLVVAIFLRDGLLAIPFPDLLISIKPLWIYIVGGVGCIIFGFSLPSGRINQIVLTTLLFAGLHIQTQFVQWVMLSWIGAPPDEQVEMAPEPPPPPPPNPLAGRWSSRSGLTLEASLRETGDVALRIVEPGQLASAGYQAGETYVTLKPTDGGYAVQYKFRPTPPVWLVYDPAAADTCQEMVSDVLDNPLTANLDGDKLTVQLARIEIAHSSFEIRNSKILACKHINRIKTSLLEITLDRGTASTPTENAPTRPHGRASSLPIAKPTAKTSPVAAGGPKPSATPAAKPTEAPQAIDFANPYNRAKDSKPSAQPSAAPDGGNGRAIANEL